MASSTDKYFFWAKEAQKVGTPFWWPVVMMFIFYIPFLRPWWWIFLPLFLSIELRRLYIWWIQWDFAYAKTKWIMLEIIPPKEVLVPLKAMEDVFAVMFSPLSDVANFRELWCEGELNNAPYWMSWEIVSIEGKIHFYARVMAAHRSALESTLYSYYPELEIQEVPDYVRDVPQTAPNEEWDIYGEDFISSKPPAYPIKTYEKFFEPQGEKISAEEKRIDPINSLLEAMSKMGPGEQYWVQFVTAGVFDHDEPGWRKDAEDILNKITKRPGKPKDKGIMEEAIEVINMLIAGPQKVGEGEKATYKWAESAAKTESGERELLMTPGERESVTEIENKLKKVVFRTSIRGVYVAKRENWKASHKTLFRAYASHFTSGSTHLKFDGNTRPKVHYLFRKRRVFLRARRMLRNAMLRFPAYFPERTKGCMVLSPDELATLFHFPVKLSSLAFPTVERVEHRKGGPPANLPVVNIEE